MSYSSEAPFCAAASAFDTIASDYDQIFTQSAIGRAQRDAVWRVLQRTFKAGSQILEINCGTGEDAFFLSRSGMKVYACDASENMIAAARRRQCKEAPLSDVKFDVLACEKLGDLNDQHFDGVLSNFGGLNCVANLAHFGSHLAALVKPGGRAVLCFCSRLCAWEIAWFLCQGKVKRAFRRTSGSTTATLNQIEVHVMYPTVREIRSAMRPWFALQGLIGVGITVPPSYLEPWARSHRGTLGVMAFLDRKLSVWPGVRVCGDHVLLVMERTSS